MWGGSVLPLAPQSVPPSALRSPDEGNLDRGSMASLFGWGSAMAIAILYSHEFGLCGLVGMILVIPIDRLVRSSPIPLMSRLTTALKAEGWYLAGVILPIAVFVGIYAASGKAGTLIKTATTVLTVTGSGEFGGLPFPLDSDSFLSIRNMMSSDMSITRGVKETPLYRIRFCSPPAVYLLQRRHPCFQGLSVASGLRARRRALALTLLGLASFKYTLVRRTSII